MTFVVNASHHRAKRWLLLVAATLALMLGAAAIALAALVTDSGTHDLTVPNKNVSTGLVDIGNASVEYIGSSAQNQASGTGTVVRRPQTNSNSGWVFGDGSKRLTPIIGVVTKAKGKSVRTRFGIDRYEEMIFIYLPPQFGVVPGQAQPQQPNPNQSGGGITDANGDGIDDSIKPNTNANTNQSPRN